MDCKCEHSKTFLSIAILVFAVWPTQIVSATASRWVVILAAALILLGEFCPCKDGTCKIKSLMVKPKAKKKVVRKRK